MARGEEAGWCCGTSATFLVGSQMGWEAASVLCGLAFARRRGLEGAESGRSDWVAGSLKPAPFFHLFWRGQAGASARVAHLLAVISEHTVQRSHRRASFECARVRGPIEEHPGLLLARVASETEHRPVGPSSSPKRGGRAPALLFAVVAAASNLRDERRAGRKRRASDGVGVVGPVSQSSSEVGGAGR
jgi:hypothetical protein